MARLISDDVWGILTVYQEAAGESFDGKLAVAEVIRRRAHQRYSSDGTIVGTVLWPLQFSGWNAKDPVRIKAAKIDDETPAVKECIKAWYDSIRTNVSGGALLYFNPQTASPDWNFDELELVGDIGNHRFYRLKGAI